LELQDYPTLYRESDSSAINAQKRHFWLVRAKVALLLVIAGVASIAWSQEPNLRTSAAIVLAIFLVVSIVLSAIMDMRKFDRVWFSSRAVAESIKTESWSFMMKVEPYDGTISDSKAEERFLNRLDKILHLQPSLCSELTPYLQQGPLITNYMRQMRNESLENRRTYYVQSRIHDQRSWYAKNAKWNKDREALWFIITWILQLAAAVLAIIVIGFRDLIINPVGILTTAGASALSWLHARSYRELSQTYGLVTQEIALLEDRANKASTEEKLAEIVLDVERTISREHTIWLARRL